jgi:hypothetical protein
MGRPPARRSGSGGAAAAPCRVRVRTFPLSNGRALQPPASEAAGGHGPARAARWQGGVPGFSQGIEPRPPPLDLQHRGGEARGQESIFLGSYGPRRANRVRP